MYEPERSLNDLAALARQGEEWARAALHERLAPHLPVILGRALRQDVPDTGLNRRIRRAALALYPAAVEPARGPGLLRRFAGKILEKVTGGPAQSAAPLQLRETIAC